jgi:hypothetical protein
MKARQKEGRRGGATSMLLVAKGMVSSGIDPSEPYVVLSEFLLALQQKGYRSDTALKPVPQKGKRPFI